MEAIRRLVGVLSTVSQRCPSRCTSLLSRVILGIDSNTDFDSVFAANIEAVLPVLESITI